MQPYQYPWKDHEKLRHYYYKYYNCCTVAIGRLNQIQLHMVLKYPGFKSDYLNQITPKGHPQQVDSNVASNQLNDQPQPKVDPRTFCFRAGDLGDLGDLESPLFVMFRSMFLGEAWRGGPTAADIGGQKCAGGT